MPTSLTSPPRSISTAFPGASGRWSGYGGRSRCDLCRLGGGGLSELARELNGLGDAFLAGDSLHPSALGALESPLERPVVGVLLQEEGPMKRIDAIIQPFTLDALKERLANVRCRA